MPFFRAPKSARAYRMNVLRIIGNSCAKSKYLIPKRDISIDHRNIVKPGKVAAQRHVPDSINKPPYEQSSWSISNFFKPSPKPEIKTGEQILGMRRACSLARSILTEAGKVAQAGVTTDRIDEVVHDACIRNNAYPSPLLYKKFPKSVCTSVNNVACHGIPDDRELLTGDIINIDVTVYLDGYHGDCSEMFFIGEVDTEAEILCTIAENCRDAAIEICGPGVPLCRIGQTISSIACDLGYQVIPDFCGHGIGSYFHGPPDIIHVTNDFPGLMLPGMTFTIEPVITEGNPAIEMLQDGWTVISKDNSRSAQYEHTVLITEDGVEILTV